MTTVLRGITWQNPRGYEPLVAASAAWHAARPHVEVIWDQLPWYHFEEHILGSLAAGDGRYDLIMFDHPWTGTLAAERWLVPWNELVPPSYLDALRRRVVAPSLESYERAGLLWALPLDAACHAALARVDLVDPEGLPHTWEDVAVWARAHHRPPARYGLALSVEGVLGHCLFLSAMAGLGHPAYHDEENPTCDRVAAIHALTLLRGLLHFAPPGSARWGPWDIYDHLCRHDDVAYSPSIFAYVNYFGDGPRGNALRVSLAPHFEGHGSPRPILGGVGLGIAHTCPHLSDARDFGLFVMDDRTQRTIFPDHHGQPAAWSAWRDDEINSRTHSFYRDLAANMAHAYVRPRYPGFHALELGNGRTLQGWWEGERSLSDTLAALNATG